jgi:replicative DNA helicase
LVSTEYGPRRIDSIHSPVRVWAMTSDSRLALAQAGPPWINGIDRLYQLTFASGRSLVATRRHRLFTLEGWKPIASLCPLC